MNTQQKELWKEIEEAGRHATPGEQAIIGMLVLILSQMQEQASEHKAFTEKFNRLTANGSSMMVTAS